MSKLPFMLNLRELVSLELGLEERVSNNHLSGPIPSHLRRETL